MAYNALSTFQPNKLDPFAAQQELFEKSTGITDELFTRVTVKTAGHNNYDVFYDSEGTYGQYNYKPKDTTKTGSVKWNYEMPEDGVLYAYAKIDNAENMLVSGGGSEHWFNIKRPYIFSAGHYKKGETVSFFSNISEQGVSGNADIYVCVLNQDVFDRGYDLLNDEKLTVTDFSSTEVKGTIDVKADGLMYTSIPYEPGWTAFVDGEETEITPVADAMCAVYLDEGSHEISFKYSPAGFIPGVVAGAAALFIFIAMIVATQLHRRRKDVSADNTADSAKE